MIDRRQSGPDSIPPRARRGLLVGVVLAGLLFAPSLSRAEDEALRSSFSGFVEAAPQVVVQRGRGSVGTNFNVTGRKANFVTNMTFRLGGGVKGPEFESIWGKPRPVLFAGALIPINESSTVGTQVVETSVPQTGTETIEFSKFSIEYQTSAVAGFGMEFVVPFFDSELAITPAIESLHLVTRYVGEASLQLNTTGSSVTQAVRAKEEIVQHFLGPALRVGTPTFVFHGVAVDFFLDVSLLFDVAGTRKAFSASGQGSDRGTFTFETGTGVAQIGSGFQLRWP